MKTLKHKGYEGSIEYCHLDEIYHGKVLNIDHLVTYEGNTLEELEEDFYEACEELDKMRNDENRFQSFSTTARVSKWDTIEPIFNISDQDNPRHTSGLLKYFGDLKGKKVRVTI